MKKLLFNLALVTSSVVSYSQDSIVLEDFDQNRNINTWIPQGGSFLVNSDSFPGSPENQVGFFNLTIDRIDENANFVGSLVEDVMGRTGSFQSYNIDEYPYYTIDLYSEDPFNFAMKVEDGDLDPKPTLAEVFVDYETPGEWQTFVFDFSDAIGLGTKNEVILLMDIFNDVTPKEFYFDNFTAYKELPTINSIEKEVKQNSLITYPNPATSTINISSEGITGSIESITVSDILGNELRTINENLSSLNVSDLSAGIYTLTITTNTNKYTNNFIKE